MQSYKYESLISKNPCRGLYGNVNLKVNIFIMKNLNDKKIKKMSLCKVYGGGSVTTQGSKKTVINGCNVIEITSDSFDDKDGDGKWDSNESGSKCISYLTN